MNQGVEEGLSASSCSALFLPRKTQKTSTGIGSLRSGQFLLEKREVWAGVRAWETKGAGKPPGTDRVPLAPTARGHLGATPMPPLSQAALSCRDAGRARHLSGPTGLDLLCWGRCVPGFPGELTAHCEVLLGAISRVPPQVHPGLMGYPVPASVPNHHRVDT